MITDSNSFGGLIRNLRTQRELQSTQVAKSLGITLPYLSQLESDRAMPSEALARRIARFFNFDEDRAVFLARRSPRDLQRILEQSPRSAVTYLSTVAGTGNPIEEVGRKPMVTLIAQHAEDLEFAKSLAPQVSVSGKEALRDAPLGLPDTFDIIRPSIVALASRVVATEVGGKPMFPYILGTGFVVDGDGIVATNRHVVDALEKLPPHPTTGTKLAVAIVWGRTEVLGENLGAGILLVDIKAYSSITSFSCSGPFYGEDLPDLGFVQLNVRGIPALPLVTQANVLRQGLEVATAGFPLGTAPLLAYGKVGQLTPFLRRGVISSVLPFPCPNPHGFTMDIMSQGGASGSPVFLTDSPKVVGMLHAGIEHANFTFAIPSRLVQDALNACTNGAALDLAGVPTLQALMEQAPRTQELSWDSFLTGPFPNQSTPSG